MVVSSTILKFSYLFLLLQDLIHGAPIGKPVASRAKVTAVYGEDNEQDIEFTRM